MLGVIGVEEWDGGKAEAGNRGECERCVKVFRERHIVPHGAQVLACANSHMWHVCFKKGCESL